MLAALCMNVSILTGGSTGGEVGSSQTWAWPDLQNTPSWTTADMLGCCIRGHAGNDAAYRDMLGMLHMGTCCECCIRGHAGGAAYGDMLRVLHTGTWWERCIREHDGNAAYEDVLGRLWCFLGQADRCIIDGCSAEFACWAAGR